MPFELWLWPKVDGHRTREWYRFLDLGLRIPIVSGTDKMEAASVLGATRTYTYTGSPEIDFAAWAEAIRAGRTFVTTAHCSTSPWTASSLALPWPVGTGTHSCTWRVAQRLST